MDDQTARRKIIQRANSYSVSAMDIAEYFVATVDDIIPIQNGHFMEFNGKKWEYKKKIATEYFMQVRDSLEKVAASDELSSNAIAHLRSRIGWLDSRLGTIVSYIKGLTSHTLIDWDSKPDILNVGNGIVDLTDGSLIPHTNQLLLERITDINYNPGAPKPERWLQFLYEVFDGKKEIIEYVQRVVGYCLTGETREQKMFYLIGKQGANGKSVFLDTIKHVLGDYATTADPTVFTKSTITIRNDLARLKGRRLVVLPELDADARVDEVIVKRITGNDMITARFLHQETFEFRPEAKVVVASNYDFKSSGSPSLWRRIISIPFNVSFRGKEDPSLRYDLYHEYEGILKWAVDGAVMYYSEGLREVPGLIHDTVSQMRQDSSPIRVFAHDRLDLGRSGAHITKADLYSEYKNWCMVSGEEPESIKKFGKSLRDAFTFVSDFVNGEGRCWKYVELKQEKRTRGISVHPKDFSILTEAEEKDLRQ